MVRRERNLSRENFDALPFAFSFTPFPSPDGMCDSRSTALDSRRLEIKNVLMLPEKVSELFDIFRVSF